MTTTFTFYSPVFLDGASTYALRVTSTSTNYKLFVSELGKTVLGSTRRVSEQPLTGSLYKTQNVGPLSESPFEDIKMIVRRAAFTTSTNATLNLENEPILEADLTTNPIETNSTAGSGTAFGGNPKILKINQSTTSGVLSIYGFEKLSEMTVFSSYGRNNIFFYLVLIYITLIFFLKRQLGR